MDNHIHLCEKVTPKGCQQRRSDIPERLSNQIPLVYTCLLHEVAVMFLYEDIHSLAHNMCSLNNR